jgi:SAM-dependent methyltransferase
VNRREWLTGGLALLAAAKASAAEEAPAPMDDEYEEPAKEPFSLFVPTPERAVIRLLELARVGPRDNVLDLGSGDGRFPILAAKRFGARGRGVDINPDLVKQSIAEARRQGVGDRVRFEQGDVMETDASSATVVTMYLFPALVNRLKPRLLAQLRPGARIVIYDYTMSEWPPEEALSMYVPERYLGRGGDVTMRLWIVPANFSGRWSGAIEGRGTPFELAIRQNFQRIDGSARLNAAPSDLYTSHVRGADIELLAEPDRNTKYFFTGRLEGESIRGRVRIERGSERATATWRARRTAAGTDIFGAA